MNRSSGLRCKHEGDNAARPVTSGRSHGAPEDVILCGSGATYATRPFRSMERYGRGQGDLPASRFRLLALAAAEDE